jgi:hypothetical protein
MAVLFPGTARFEVKGPPSPAVQVQASTNLSSWLPLMTITNFTGRADAFDSNAGAFRQRFYRALTP